jgi:hypothetical protein
MDASIPMSAAWAIAISQWVIRLLPFLITSFVILGPLFAAGLVAALALLSADRVAQTVGIGFVVLAVAQALLCAIMLYGIHAAYATIPG